MASFGPDQDLQWVAANLAVLHQAALPRRTPGRVQRFHRNKGLPGSCLPCPVVLAFRQEGCRIPPFAGEHELLEGFALPWSQVALLEIVRQRGGITFVADRNSGPCLVAFRDSKDFARLVGRIPIIWCTRMPFFANFRLTIPSASTGTCFAQAWFPSTRKDSSR